LWEPASQVHAPNLIKEFQKIRPSGKKNTTINCGLASETMTKLSPPQQHRDYSSLTEERHHRSNTSSKDDDKQGTSSKDKKEKGNPRNDIVPFPVFHINSCTMNNDGQLPPPLSIEELHNMDFSSVDPGKKIYDELLCVMDETYTDLTRDIEAARAAEAGPSNPIEGPINKPPSITAKDVNELEYEEPPRSNQTSPALTEDLHPGYPYRENIGDNNNLPKPHYSRPYLAAQVDYVTGDPRIRGKDEKGDIPYDEGPLTVTPFDTVPEDIEDEVATYPFGEDAYLDTDFLRAMGNLDDRGLAAEGLRLVQL
jgi:hypothetical protein